MICYHEYPHLSLSSSIERKFEALKRNALTEASNIYETLTEKYYQAGSQLYELLETVQVPPASPTRQRTTSVFSSFLNNTMIEVKNTTTVGWSGQVEGLGGVAAAQDSQHGCDCIKI